MSEENNYDRKMLWMLLLKAETTDDLDRLEKYGDPDINEAIARLREMSADENIREIARQREEELMEESSVK